MLNVLIYTDAEIWSDIVYKDIKSMYEVSNYGRVRNKKTSKMISIATSEKGYKMVSLMSNRGTQDTFKLARIVAHTFIEKPNSDPSWTVNHKNGDKSDNSIYNLEWTTFTDNIRHSFEIGLNEGLKGTTNGNNLYPEELIEMICLLLSQKVKTRNITKQVKELYPEYPINRYLMYDLRHRKTWKHISNKYTF